jgi:hypothetical protein
VQTSRLGVKNREEEKKKSTEGYNSEATCKTLSM